MANSVTLEGLEGMVKKYGDAEYDLGVGGAQVRSIRKQEAREALLSALRALVEERDEARQLLDLVGVPEALACAAAAESRLAECQREERERCAKVADDYEHFHCAAAIRALLVQRAGPLFAPSLTGNEQRDNRLWANLEDATLASTLTRHLPRYYEPGAIVDTGLWKLSCRCGKLFVVDATSEQEMWRRWVDHVSQSLQLPAGEAPFSQKPPAAPPAERLRGDAKP